MAAIIVDATIVNVAVPSIIDDLGHQFLGRPVAQEAYTLVFAAFLLMFGRLADRGGDASCCSASVWSSSWAPACSVAISQSGPELIGARLIQGSGGALMLPTSLSIINATFRGKDRAIAFAIWG